MKKTNPIDWFRQASPYINAHRQRTLVLCFDASDTETPRFATLIHDLALLSHLGVRLVLVFGLRSRIATELATAGIEPRFHHHLRITDDASLARIVTAVAETRIAIEAKLSMGLPNTPMSGAHLSVASGNFVTAQPYGVHDGIDHLLTGTVRQIHANAIRRQIENRQLVLLSPLGYSRTGEVFNVLAEDVAMHAAIALKAEKLAYLLPESFDAAANDALVDCSVSEAALLLSNNVEMPAWQRRVLNKAVQACHGGVARVHLLSQQDPDALLRELFTHDGAGTLISADDYDTLRSARTGDIGGILELVRPLEQNGTLAQRSREQLELDIDHFVVSERDGLITACGALLPIVTHDDTEASSAEIACLATHPEYRNHGRAEKLLRYLERKALAGGIQQLFLLTTRTGHWFVEHGFEPVAADALPLQRQARYDEQRNSKVLVKYLRTAHR